MICRRIGCTSEGHWRPVLTFYFSGGNEQPCLIDLVVCKAHQVDDPKEVLDGGGEEIANAIVKSTGFVHIRTGVSYVHIDSDFAKEADRVFNAVRPS